MRGIAFAFIILGVVGSLIAPAGPAAAADPYRIGMSGDYGENRRMRAGAHCLFAERVMAATA